MHQADGKLDSLLCIISETASKPKKLSMPGNILATSKLTRTEPLLIIFLQLYINWYVFKLIQRHKKKSWEI